MVKPKNSKIKCIWLFVFLLFICVTVTAVSFLSRLNSFLLDDQGAISLIDYNASGTNVGSDDTEDKKSSAAISSQAPVTEPEHTNNGDTTATPPAPSDSSTAPHPSQPPKNPGFEASDSQTVWSTDTQVEIFRISYVNGEQVITVKSDNGDKVIAPGTQNSYTFKLKNTGNVALDYTVYVEAYFTLANIDIPITGRLNRYDGKWIVGGKNEYVKVSVLNTAEDKSTLAAGKYTYYTLDWLWSFENGNDELDTMLGNLAVDQDLIFTIVIKTIATESSDPHNGGGILPPQTSDNTNITMGIVLTVSAFSAMLFLILKNERKKRCCNTEAN